MFQNTAKSTNTLDAGISPMKSTGQILIFSANEKVMDEVFKQLSQRQRENLGINRTEKHCLPYPWLGKCPPFFAQESFLKTLGGEVWPLWSHGLV